MTSRNNSKPLFSGFFSNKPLTEKLLLAILMLGLVPLININLSDDSFDFSQPFISETLFISLILFISATAISFRTQKANRSHFLKLYSFLLGFIWSVSWMLGKLPDFGIIPKESFLMCVIASLLFFSWCAHWFICFFLSLRPINSRRECRSNNSSNSNHRVSPLDFSPAIIFICWLPWLIALYPGVFAPNDTLDQLQQYFGYQSWTSLMVGDASQGVYLNNHHPVIHTILLGSFVAAGNSLGSANIGLFCFVIFQTVVIILGISLTVRQCRELNIDSKFLYIAVAFISLNPVFPILSSCVTKDTLFSGFLLIFIAETLRLNKAFLRNPEDRKSLFRCLPPLVLSGLFASLLRQTMVYVYVAILLLLLSAMMICWRTKRLSSLKMLRYSIYGVTVVILINLAIVKVAFPLARIAPSSEAETLAVPIAQIARYANTNPEQFSHKYSSAVKQVLDLDSLSSYYPANIDSIKNARKVNASSDDYKALTESWISILVEDFGGAVRAWAQLCRSYFSLSYSYSYIWTNSFSYPAGNSMVNHLPQLQEMGLSFHESGINTETRNMIADLYENIISSLFAVFFNMGLYAWLIELCLICSIIKHNPLSISVFTIAFLLLGTLLFSPADSLLRYMQPLMLLCPLVMPLAASESITTTRIASDLL